MTGQHCVIGRIHEAEPQLLQSVPNEQIIVKMFRDHCMLVRNNATRISDATLGNVMEQYQQLKRLGIPVAELYNEQEIADGCGFFLFENVPHPFVASWQQGTPISALNEKQRADLRQLKQYFSLCYDANIVPDFRPDNLRYRSDGTLVVIDFREAKISLDEKDMFYQDMLRTFHARNGDEIYEFLNPMAQIAAPAQASDFTL